MKFLYFGDRHATFKKPSNRIDDFLETCKNKDLEIMEIARREKVAALLQPGDFFEEKDIKGENEFIQEISDRYNLFNPKELLESFRKTGILNPKLLEDYIPMVCVAGNHDLIGENLDSLSQTTLGFLSSLGQLNLVTKENPMFFTTEDGKRVAITGTHYHIGMDDPSYIEDYIIREKLGDYHIHICHGMLSDKDMGKLIKHTLIDNIVETKADITLCGHNHIGFGILQIDGKYFVNIGSVTRYTGDIKEIKRTPSVALIDISSSGISIEEIPLKSAPDGSSVIDRTAIEEDKKRKATIKTFKDEIKSLKSSGKSLSIKDFVETVADSKSIDKDLKEDILDRIVVKEMENAKIKNEKCNAFVSSIILENFQSHEYTEIDLSEGFNVLVGESRQGKSAIERSFYWVYENKPSGKGFIKRGADFARVTINLSDGTSVSRMIEAKKNGKNIYEIVYSDGTVETGNTKILPNVQRILGFSNFFIDSKLSLPVNFYKQGDGWYLIGDNLTSTDKARVVGALNGTNLADAIVRELDLENNKVINTNKYSLSRVESINKELEELKDLDDLKRIIEENSLLLEKYQLLLEKRDRIKKIKETYDSYTEELSKVKEILRKLEELDKINLDVEKAKSFLKERGELEEILLSFEGSTKNLKDVGRILTSLTAVESDLSYIESFKQKCNEIFLISKYTNNYTAYIHNKKVNENILKSLKDIEKEEDRLKKVVDSKKALDDVESLFKSVLDLKSKKDATRKIIDSLGLLEGIESDLERSKERKEFAEEIEKAKNAYEVKFAEGKTIIQNRVRAERDVLEKEKEYKDILVKMEICPICKRPLEEETVNHIVEGE